MQYSAWGKATASKTHGSWNLHSLLPSNLDFFIMLSSMIGIFGNSSQANYAAGNTYQDCLARYRQSLGLKATALDLGAVSEIGQLATEDEMRRRVEDSGFFTMLNEDDIYAMLAISVKESRSAQLVTGVKLPSQIQGNGKELPYWIQRPLFSHLHQITSHSSVPAILAPTGIQLSTLIASASDIEAKEVVLKALIAKLSKILSVSEEKLDRSRTMAAFGVDSMVAVDLRNWFLKEVQADMAIFEIMGSKELNEVAAMATGKSMLRCKKK
jgi:hypothetical protein